MEKESRVIPFEDEAALAHLAYSRWEQEQAESLAEYIYRRRTVDLAYLVRRAIEEELTENQRRCIRMRYYENRTPAEMARRTGLHPSTVTHTLQLAERKLHHALRYVVEYQNGMRDDALLPLAVRKAMAVAAARYTVSHTFAERLRALRTGEKLEMSAVSQSVNIAPERLAELESGAEEPNAGELLRLSAFFGVTVDALLKGGAA